MLALDTEYALARGCTNPSSDQPFVRAAIAAYRGMHVTQAVEKLYEYRSARLQQDRLDALEAGAVTVAAGVTRHSRSLVEIYVFCAMIAIIQCAVVIALIYLLRRSFCVGGRPYAPIEGK